MNYDHAFHAGSFSDVLKHSIYAACLSALQSKEKPFRALDVFAGHGVYDLNSAEAASCPEWQSGIIPFLNASIPHNLNEFFAPYMSCIKRINMPSQMRFYPGSPELSRLLTRANDRITLLEANSKMIPSLRKKMQNDKRMSILNSDAWKSTLGLVPPPEKRGVLLIDPPFETPNELERLMTLIGMVSKKWRNGVVIAWLPLKSMQEEQFVLSALHTMAADFGQRPETLFMKLQPHPYTKVKTGLTASALIIFNPPWDVSTHAEAALQYMATSIRTEATQHERYKMIAFPAA